MNMYKKEIIFDPETLDFAMYLDGELVGFARTYQTAEVELDNLVYELLNRPYFEEQIMNELGVKKVTL